MQKSVLKYIKMMFLLVLLLEGVVPHYHILGRCAGKYSTFNFNNQSTEISFNTSEHIVVHGVATMLKERENIVSPLIALAFFIPIFYSLSVVIKRNLWRSPFIQTTIYNYVIVVYLFFRPPPIAASL